MTRLIVYNIEYLEGLEGQTASYLKFWRRVIHPKEIKEKLVETLKKYSPDILSFVEVGGGSFFENSYIDYIKKELGMAHRMERSKYNFHSFSGLLKHIPLFSKQTNGVLSKFELLKPEVIHLKEGIKRSVLKVEVALPNPITLFLVHLSLGEETRKKQIEEIAKHVKLVRGPVILAGDFNTADGEKEIRKLLKQTGLNHKFWSNGGTSLTYPTWHPRKRLDYVLASEDVHVKNYEVLDVHLSDHLPVLVDFEVEK
jgi:endonuclease/exonuclease/phosphatase family metal-dependent hydrolase